MKKIIQEKNKLMENKVGKINWALTNGVQEFADNLVLLEKDNNKINELILLCNEIVKDEDVLTMMEKTLSNLSRVAALVQTEDGKQMIYERIDCAMVVLNNLLAEK